jgi:protoporphyrinogen oxidase
MSSTPPITILGAGIAGLSASYHFGHENCVIFERAAAAGGHTRSEHRFGFTFDQGPHVSFTKHAYVRDLFTRSTGGAFREFDVRTRNYFRGEWIDHPAQIHLWQVPEPLRTACYREMKVAIEAASAPPPQNYRQWLESAFGRTFAETFPEVYTRKYWVTEAQNLSTDWLGVRVLKPDIRQLELGLQVGTRQSAHSLQTVRYPAAGGFESFLTELSHGAEVLLGREIASIDLASRRLWFSDGETQTYERLLSTLPLNAFISRCQNVPNRVREAAEALDCTRLLLVNVCAPHPARIDGHWFYVYDSNKLSTRIHLSERLSPKNAPTDHTAVQVEVYFGRDRPYAGAANQIATRVTRELLEMGFVDEAAFSQGQVEVFWRWIPYANIVFSHDRRSALDCIFQWLEQFGLEREPDELNPATDWTSAAARMRAKGTVMLAGRFAQWKNFWTDDCILRGRQLAGADS